MLLTVTPLPNEPAGPVAPSASVAVADTADAVAGRAPSWKMQLNVGGVVEAVRLNASPETTDQA